MSRTPGLPARHGDASRFPRPPPRPSPSTTAPPSSGSVCAARSLPPRAVAGRRRKRSGWTPPWSTAPWRLPTRERARTPVARPGCTSASTSRSPKAARPDLALNFVCSAWPEEMEVERVFPVRRGGPAPAQQYMGRQFRELDEEMQSAVRDYLEQRGVNNDELGTFLHSYMENKEQTELVRWLRNVEGYLKK